MNRQGHADGRNWVGESLLKRAIARVTIPQLWNHFALFLLALAFLTAEWVLRKQSNLL